MANLEMPEHFDSLKNQKFLVRECTVKAIRDKLNYEDTFGIMSEMRLSRQVG
jgi:hypothetical protein